MTNSEESPEAPEGEETGEGITGKKKSKFQTFKNFFAKKKKSKDVPSPTGEPQLEPSRSGSDNNAPDLESILLPPPAETDSNECMGDKSLTHDDIFISEAVPDAAGEASYQENPLEEVKTLQVSIPVQPSLSAGDTGSGNDQVPFETPSKSLRPLAPEGPMSPLCCGLPVDFNTPASPLGCLDSSAARHRIAMNPRKQAAFSKKNQHLSVEQLEQELLGPGEGKTSPSILLEDDAGQKKEWGGLLIQNALNFNKDGNDNASSVTSEALHHSCNTGLHLDGSSALESETRKHLETDVWVSLTLSSPNEPSPLTNCKRGDNRVKDEENKRTWAPTDDLKPQPSGLDTLESSGSFHSKTKAVGFQSSFPSALKEHNVVKEFEVEDTPKPCSQLMDERTNVSRLGSGLGQTYSSSVCEVHAIPLEADPALCVPPLPSSALTAPSDASKDLAQRDNLTVKEMELQPSEGPSKPTDSPQGLLAALDIDPDRALLQNIEDKKPCPPKLSSSVLSRKIKRHNISTVQESTAVFFRGLFTVESARVASEITPPVETAGVQPGKAVVGEENDNLDEILMVRAKSVSAKPVRFTIAAAWQRSLSGGSSAVDNSCPRNSPTSPIRPELFEGVPSPDTATQATALNSSERLDWGSRNVVATWNSPIEWPSEEAQGQENPFGVKLRRTSSLLKYQTEHRDPPRQVPPLATSTAPAVKVNTKSPGSGCSLPNLTTVSKGLAANSNIQEKNLPNKSSAESSGNLSSEPTSILLAKLNQQGFLASPAEGLKKQEEEDLVAITEQRERSPTGQPPSQKQQLILSSGSSPKKSGLYHPVGHLESKGPLKSAPPTAKDAPFRIAPLEVPLLEQEMRSLPILPGTSCSSAEPPWLSLAKKKAKAWSEMPRAVK